MLRFPDSWFYYLKQLFANEALFNIQETHSYKVAQGTVLVHPNVLLLLSLQGKSNEELLSFVTNGGTLKTPDECDELMKNLMTVCWQPDPKLRPQFLEVILKGPS